MAKSRGDIVGLLDQLDHPDAVRQQKIRDRLVEEGAGAVEQLTANLRLVDNRVRTVLVQVLGDIGDERALLPLMRYVFDERDNFKERNARGLAMQAIMRIARPRHASRLFEFLVDMKDDPDPFVRTYVVEAFGKLGLSECVAHVREALDDSSEFVRERAQKTLDELQGEPDDAPSNISAEALLKEVRRATGARLNHCVKLLRERDDAFELASQLVREGKDRTMIGLQVLQSLDNPAARDVAVRHFQLTDSSADRAASLRLLAEHLQANARPSEVRAIQKGLRSSDKFIELAALSAAGRSGHLELTRRAIDATQAGNYAVAATVSESLSKVADKLDDELADPIFESLRMVRGLRRHNEQHDLIRTEAYLLRALCRLLDTDHEHAKRAQLEALTSLRDSTSLKPIVITALELLDRLVPEDGYDGDQRWHPADAAGLVPLAEHANPTVQKRALEVIRRGAPGDAPNLTHAFERLMKEDPAFVGQSVVPAIFGTDGPNAREQLARLAASDNARVRRSAESALKRLRSRQAHIDVEFRRAGD